MTDQARQLVAVAAGIAGETYNTVLSGTRKRPLPICRYLVAQELVRQGLSTVAAGRELNINHATVTHGKAVLDKITEDNGYYNTDELFIKREFQRLKDDL